MNIINPKLGLVPCCWSLDQLKASALAEIWLICLLHAISNDHFQIALCSSQEQDWLSQLFNGKFGLCWPLWISLVMCCQFLGGVAWVQVRP